VDLKKHRSTYHGDNRRTGPNRDLRPAVFIKDLKKRSYALEEEKAQHHRDQQRAQAVPEHASKA